MGWSFVSSIFSPPPPLTAHSRAQRSIQLQLHVPPPSSPKNDYSYISFPPTASILSISSGVVIATPPLTVNVSAGSQKKKKLRAASQ